MSFAIYGESLTYIHLVSAKTRSQALQDFIADIKSVGVDPATVYGVVAAKGRDEDQKLQNSFYEYVKLEKQNVAQ